MAKLVINQPYLFPQLHWWHRAIHCDKIVILDDVQHNKNFPINRTLAFDGNKPKYITINISKEQKRELIFKMVTHETFSKQSVINTFTEYYKDAKYFKEIKDILDIWNHSVNSKKVLDLVLWSIDICSNYLNVNFKYILSSSLKINSYKNDRLIDICKGVNSNELVLGMGSKNYVDPDIDKYNENGIVITYQDWKCPVQNYSILDCLARYGLDKTKEILEI